MKTSFPWLLLVHAPLCDPALYYPAVSQLMYKYNVDPGAIGRLEVGTESNLDRAKSVKSYLMQLFASHGNHSISGVDNINACFGGTAALMNTVAWMESREWDGKLGIVVASDVAVYQKGPARPTGGAGAVAMLIGPNAPLVFERGLSATYMAHTFDFYKPDPFSPYPLVDGKGSIVSYKSAFQSCCDQIQAKIFLHTQQNIAITSLFDHLVFHSPYTKMVQKAFAQITDSDSLVEQAQNMYMILTDPSTLLSRQLGNLYCASVYANLISLLCYASENLIGKRVGVFSYGSGLASMLFSIHVRGPVHHIKNLVNVEKRLTERTRLSPEEFESCMIKREVAYGKADWRPHPSHNSHLQPGVFVLDHVDKSYRRHYKQILP